MNENSPLQNDVNNLVGTKSVPDNSPHKLPPHTIIRTFEGDLAEAMAHGKTSYARLAIEQNKNSKGEEIVKNASIETGEEKSHLLRNIIFVFLGIVLLGGGGYGGYYLFTKSTLFVSYTTVPVQKVEKAKSVLPKDSEIRFDMSNQSKLVERLNAIVLSQNKPNTIVEILPSIQDRENLRVLSIEELKKAFDLYIPDQVNRSLTQEYMIGVYTDNNSESSIFVAVKNNYFQNAFSGLVSWESVLPNDIGIFVASSTRLIRGSFVDKIIKNRDVRAFVDENKRTLFVYSFVNRDILVFAKNEVTLAGILARLDANTFSR